MKFSLNKTLIIWTLIAIQSCGIQNESKTSEEEIWKLGWRLVENTWAENYNSANLQFDNLLSLNQPINERFLIEGLISKAELSKDEEILKIISLQSDEVLQKICEKSFAKGLKPCEGHQEEVVENKELQLEIIKLFVEDQAIRGNVMTDIILKYQIDSTTIKTEYDRSNPDEIDIDEINRNRLKEIFKDFGFPTRKLIGKDAMRGIFLIIQHADGDKVWQESQLPNIKLAVKNGDLKNQNYTYLFDRIKVNSGQPQRFGTQFSKVDRKNKIAELRETEDLANLNQRRREMDMMPIEMYRRLILRD